MKRRDPAGGERHGNKRSSNAAFPGTRRAIAASVLGELRQLDTGFMHRLMARPMAQQV